MGDFRMNDTVKILDDDYPPMRKDPERRQSGGHMYRPGSIMVSRDSLSSRGVQITHVHFPDESRAENAIVFDLDQPWQRSLQRELNKIQITSSPRRDYPELLLLGRNDSGDFAQELDRDDITVSTNASSTVPTKSQIIHRTTLQRCNALFHAEEDESYQEPTVHASKGNIIATGQWLLARPIEDERDETTVPGKRQPRQITEAADGNSTKPILGNRTSRKPIPMLLPSNRSDDRSRVVPLERARVLSDDRQSPFLEMEVTSDDGLDPSLIPDPACFCWGYSITDFFLPPHPSNYRRKRRVAAGIKTATVQNERLNGILEEAIDMSEEKFMDWEAMSSYSGNYSGTFNAVDQDPRSKHYQNAEF